MKCQFVLLNKLNQFIHCTHSYLTVKITFGFFAAIEVRQGRSSKYKFSKLQYFFRILFVQKF
jgi:hypothetical protein